MQSIFAHKQPRRRVKRAIWHGLSSFVIAPLMLSLGSAAHAADDKGLVPLKTAPISATQGLNFNLSSSNGATSNILSSSNISGLSQNGADISGLSGLGLNNTGLFDVPTGSMGCLAGEQACLSETTRQLDLGFSKSLKKTKQGGLDVELVPSASVRFDEGEQSALVGAVVRIGDDLRSKDVASNTWYVFAGADAEALSYSPDRATRGITSDFYLQDRIIIGDAQAGIGYRIGDADLSLGYIRREVNSFNNTPGSAGFSSSEDAAALSFTWKR
ncbi:hypothetical protein [Fretibacter rubidus]|uniref:hypothetical protein n=1 Tax=Fretibacter rubidus TaxID=570162 RepID=UPI00352B95AA